MKFGNLKVIVFIIIIFFFNNLFPVYSEDKIETVPLINLEELSPTFEEEKEELEKIENKSTILEKEENVFVGLGNFLWNDIGNWKSLYDLFISLKKDPVIGNVVSLDSNNNLIISFNRLTVTIGVKNMIIININNSTLVLPMSKAERVKEIVGKLLQKSKI